MTIRLAHVMSGASVGGGEAHLLTLAGSLPGYTWHFLLPQEGPFAEELRQRGFEVRVVELTRRVQPGALVQMVRYLRAQRIQLVHTHGARANFYGRLAARLAGVPIVVSTVHNSLFDYPIASWRRQLYVALDVWTARFAQRIICVADALARDLVERYGIPAQKVVTIHNGIDLGPFDHPRPPEETRASLGIPPEAPLIGEIARMTEQKGYEDLLRAVEILIRRHPTLRCLLVGDGPLRGELERECRRLGLAAHCLFTGVRRDIPDLLGALDVYVLPSVSEGFPIGILEAMAMRRPIVASRVSGIPELIEDGVTGWLVPPRQPDELAGAIARMLEDRAMAHRMGEAGRRVLEERFTSRVMIGQLGEVYRTLVKERLDT